MENQFNKYEFLTKLNDSLKEEIELGYITNLTDVYNGMHILIEDATIYYSDCFDICKELNATHFDQYDSECKDICQLAFCALYDFCMSEWDNSEIEELLNTRFTEEA